MATTCNFFPDPYKILFPMNVFLQHSRKAHVLETFLVVWGLQDLLSVERGVFSEPLSTCGLSVRRSEACLSLPTGLRSWACHLASASCEEGIGKHRPDRATQRMQRDSVRYSV